MPAVDDAGGKERAPDRDGIRGHVVREEEAGTTSDSARVYLPAERVSDTEKVLRVATADGGE
ncbi:hypothetical protein [Haloarchaeobius sp. HRN-SO-5]|uniref:hypothetical protein n=1 Tax=Haloarchaeobius sp. HRN-SO-5 TaxID=3446118 RepID=UPI003EBA0CA0